MKQLIIGSRGSRLALFQSNKIKRLLEVAHPSLEVGIKVIKTKGDIYQSRDLDKSLDKGLFTSELEAALHNKEIHIAVHSLKDLPTALAEGTRIGAYIKRDNPCDVWIGKTGAKMPENLAKESVIGTSSPRRKAQVLAMYPQLQAKNIRGNVETRIEKLREGQYDGIILAAAGVERLELQNTVDYYFPIDDVLPAPGQAVIAVQSLLNDEATNEILKEINHSESEKCVYFERLLLTKIGGGCSVPLGCYCEKTTEGYSLKSFLANKELSKHTRIKISFNEEDAVKAIEKLAKELLKGIE